MSSDVLKILDVFQADHDRVLIMLKDILVKILVLFFGK